ncbi:MAG: sigma factor-like helix-turn-helix DNA-binding protein [Ruminiclostridium sp.]
MPKDLNTTVLLDFYGSLLTEKQRETLSLYYEADLSLGEISEETGITRQGVLNCIKKSEAKLVELEEQLGLARRLHEVDKDIVQLERLIYEAKITDKSVMSSIEEKLAEIKSKL